MFILGILLGVIVTAIVAFVIAGKFFSNWKIRF